MPRRRPGALGRGHIEGQDAMHHTPGMGQGHEFVLTQHVDEAQPPVVANQRLVARTDDHPLNPLGHAEQVAGLHQAQLGQRIGPDTDGQAGDLGARR